MNVRVFTTNWQSLNPTEIGGTSMDRIPRKGDTIHLMENDYFIHKVKWFLDKDEVHLFVYLEAGQ